MKICKDCRMYVDMGAQWLDVCARGETTIEPVRGMLVRPQLNCKHERQKLGANDCGPEARHYQPRFILIERRA